MLPTKNQKNLLRKYIRASNNVYNFTISYFIKCRLLRIHPESSYTFKLKVKEEFPQYVNDIPCDIYVNAMMDAYKARSNAILKHSKGDGVSELKFRSNNVPKQSIRLPKIAISAKKKDFILIC